MKDAEERFASVYSTAMQRYALAPAEADLVQAYDIGRHAMAAGFGVVELTCWHRLALDALLPGPASGVGPGLLVTRSAEFLVESLSPFEMTLRGYRGAVESLQMEVEERKHVEEQLRTAHEELEKRVEERTIELSSANQALRREIDERKRVEADLRDSEDRFRSLVASVRDYAIFMLDPQGLVASWNAGAERLKGYAAHEVLGKHVSLFYTEEDRDAGLPQRLLAAAAEEGSSTEQGWRVRKDGSRFWADVVVTELRTADGSLRGFTKVTRDVTERRQSEEAVQRAIADLKRSNDAKDQFVAVLSHELRNPLSPIRNSLYILERAAPGDPQANRALVVIGRQVGQLVRLVDDLLDITRISRNKIRLECELLELNELVRKTVEDHRSLFEQSGVELRLVAARGRVGVSADRARLAQIIGNLLQNAAKFTAQGGHATVSISVDAAKRQALVGVSDSGVGIPPELLGRLFQPFMQADATLERSKGGLGLGLALVRGLAQLHGGDVEARSEGRGQGSEFLVRLPLASEDALVAEAVGAGHVLRPRRRVLIIEDNVDAAESLRAALELDGHEVAVAYDGPDGIAKAPEFAPEIVLCDLGLPGMDGYEVARRLRADATLSSAHLVALSGYALPEDVHRSREAGFELHLAKPPDVAKLGEILGILPANRKVAAG